MGRVEKHLENLRTLLTALHTDLARNANTGVPSELLPLIDKIKKEVKRKPKGASSSDGYLRAEKSVHTLLTELLTHLNTFNASLPQDWALQQMKGIIKLAEDVCQEYTGIKQSNATQQAPNARLAVPNQDVGGDLRGLPQRQSDACHGNQYLHAHCRPQAPSGQASGLKPGFPASYPSLCENYPLLREKEIQVSGLQELEDWKHEQKQLRAELNNVKGKLHKELENKKHEQQELYAQLKEAMSRADNYKAQLEIAEAWNARQADAHGFYDSLSATPLHLKHSADHFRLSLEGFSKLLMEVVKKDPQWMDAQVTALKLDKSHLKYHLQRLVAEVCFDKLWNSDDYFFFPCFPGGSGISQGKKQFFEHYKRMSAFVDKPGGVAFPRTADLDEVQAPSPGCKPDCYSRPQQQHGPLSTSYSYRGCSCGAFEFEVFCSSKLKGLEELVWKQLVWKQFVSEETPAALSRLRESFLALLLDVWCAHLVSLAFDQPACLFKVRGGQDFVELSMVDTVMQDKDAPRKVEFMIIPGFRVGKTIIKSVVYTTLQASEPGRY